MIPIRYDYNLCVFLPRWYGADGAVLSYFSHHLDVIFWTKYYCAYCRIYRIFLTLCLEVFLMIVII